MFLTKLELKQFRCFTDKSISFSSQITLITGDNGSGKTSIVEAINYLCYFKSFRSHVLTDLMSYESDSFFLKGNFTLHQEPDVSHVIQVGYAHKKRIIKLDQKNVTSYKDTFPFFKVITLTEDDIDLIKGSPSGRRAFADQAVLFAKPESMDIYRNFRNILENRNALLSGAYGNSNNLDKIEFEVWTEKLWASTIMIQGLRILELKAIEVEINSLIDRYFDGVYEVEIQYEAKVAKQGESMEMFLQKISQLKHQEVVLKRSLFGAHLDDLVFQIKGKKAKMFASRGQQKLVSLLCKLALISTNSSNGPLPLVLIDDFISDFDKIRLRNLIHFFLSCKNQIIITSPFCDSELESLILKAHPDVISINS
ncbi:MAG: DNA replication and repair protein RecF [Candidatus Dependentiae bacterium]|nr:DNA replication and repair protein RecF [Candidatus Dependentiae bacterium]